MQSGFSMLHVGESSLWFVSGNQWYGDENCLPDIGWLEGGLNFFMAHAIFGHRPRIGIVAADMHHSVISHNMKENYGHVTHETEHETLHDDVDMRNTKVCAKTTQRDCNYNRSMRRPKNSLEPKQNLPETLPRDMFPELTDRKSVV